MYISFPTLCSWEHIYNLERRNRGWENHWSGNQGLTPPITLAFFFPPFPHSSENIYLAPQGARQPTSRGEKSRPEALRAASQGGEKVDQVAWIPTGAEQGLEGPRRGKDDIGVRIRRLEPQRPAANIQTWLWVGWRGLLEAPEPFGWRISEGESGDLNT